MKTQMEEIDRQESPSAARNGGAERLANALGWFSIGLGIAEIASPAAVSRLIGIERGDNRRLLRLYGLREIAAGGFIDKFPIGSLMNRSLTIRAGQCHVQKYMHPLLERIQKGEIDPSFVITHKLRLEDAPLGYEIFKNKQDDCIKIVLKPH